MDPVTLPDASEEARLLANISTLASRFARRLLATESAERADDAEDIAQSVVLKCLLLMRAGRWRVETTLEGYVASITWREHASARRRSTNRSERDAQFLAEREAQHPAWMDAEASVREGENERMRRLALSRVPMRCRESYRLVREEGATYREAARQLGTSMAMVVRHLARAERLLASTMLDVPSVPAAPPSAIRRGRRRRGGVVTVARL